MVASGVRYPMQASTLDRTVIDVHNYGYHDGDPRHDCPACQSRYTFENDHPYVGRFARAALVDATGATVALLTYATAPDPAGISGDGGQLEPLGSTTAPTWRTLIDALRVTAPNALHGAEGYYPSEVSARGPRGVKAMRTAILSIGAPTH